jgi:hypothetical protein
MVGTENRLAQVANDAIHYFENRLTAEGKLDADSLLWYNVPIGPKRLHPDFVILHPQRGIIVLEVKSQLCLTFNSD